VGGVASQARSKLVERGEKLGAINQLTMEMQGKACVSVWAFASLQVWVWVWVRGCVGVGACAYAYVYAYKCVWLCVRVFAFCV
jgi:hypothetical protein